MDILSLNKQPQEYSFPKTTQPTLTPRDLDFNELNLQQVLHSLHEEELNKINDCNFIEATSDLMHCEEILEAVTAKGELHDIDQVIILLNNLAMCYQRLGEVDKALAYLDGSLYNFKLFISKPSIKNEIRMNAMISKISLQSCAMLSQKSLHKNALKFAKNSQALIEASCLSLIKAYHRQLSKSKIDPKKVLPAGSRSRFQISKNSMHFLKHFENF